MCILFLFSRESVGLLFLTNWRNIYIYWFLMAISGSNCLIDIWKRCIKKSEAAEFSSWCFFGLNEVAFFSQTRCSFFFNFLNSWKFFALNAHRSAFISVKKHSLTNQNQKKAMNGFGKLENLFQTFAWSVFQEIEITSLVFKIGFFSCSLKFVN